MSNRQPVTMMYGIPEPVDLSTDFPNTVQTEQEIMTGGFLDRFSKVLDRIEQEVVKVASEVSNLLHRIEDLEKKIEVPEVVEPKDCPNCESYPLTREADEVTHWVECMDCGMRGPKKDSEKKAIEVWNEVIIYEIV